ncbi:MAG: DUF2971 domain-containing protein [bacterium]
MQNSTQFDELQRALLNELITITLRDREPVGNNTHFILQMVKEARKIRNRLSREKLEAHLKPSIEKASQRVKDKLAATNNWWHKFTRDLRVFCMAEEPDNLLMWSHYSEGHTGAVIRFRCIPKLDTPLCAAVPIDYSDKLPAIANLGEWVKYITGQHELDLGNLFLRFACTKSTHWAYEKEWRCIDSKKTANTKLFEFTHIYAEEISAVYLGCKMEAQKRQELLQSLRDKLQHVEVYECSKDQKEYTLNFTKI